MKLMLRKHRREALWARVIALCCVILTVIQSVPVRAQITLPSGREDEWSENEIMFYDPNGELCRNSAMTVGARPDGNQITWIGDSYTVHAINTINLKFAGADIHKESGKSFNRDLDPGGTSGLGIIKEMLDSGQEIRKYVVFALGTNDWDLSTSYGRTAIDELVDLLGSERTIVLVTPRTANNSYSTVVQQMKEAKSEYSNILIADWNEVSKDKISEFFTIDESKPDTKTHPNSTGYGVWVDTIYNALPAATTTVISNSGDSSGATSTGTGLSKVQADYVASRYQIAQQLSVEYGIPWETVVAQAIWESSAQVNGVNTPEMSKIARDKNNFFGIGAYDRCPYECAFTYGSVEEGWRGYYENIRKTATYRNHGVFQGATITDPIAYLTAITAAGYATAQYGQMITPTVRGIEKMAQQNGWATSAELAQQHPEMISNAAKYAAGEDAVIANVSSAMAVSGQGSGAVQCINGSSGSEAFRPYEGGDFPWYDQCDPQWGSTQYNKTACKSGTKTTCSSGCGPASFAMMATVLTGTVITPDMTTNVAREAGMYVCGEGSSWDVTRVLANHYGLQYTTISAYGTQDVINKINKYLSEGWMIHTSGTGSSPFTGSGHYIGIYGLTEDGKWLIADSNGSQGRRNTLERAHDPASVIRAGMSTGNIKAIKK